MNKRRDGPLAPIVLSLSNLPFEFHLSTTTTMKFTSKVVQAALLLAGASFSQVMGQSFVPYYTSVDIYLDPTTSGGDDTNDTRWNFSSAVNNGDCNHRRDFIFTCGWYKDLGEGNPGWVCNASNNSIGDPTTNDPFQIAQAGWYTFRHVFNNVEGILSVDFEIRDSNDALLKTWTRSDETDTIPEFVGGNRYGWFVRLGCTIVSSPACTAIDESFRLPIDNMQKCIQDSCCDYFQGFEEDTNGLFGIGGPPPSQVVRVKSLDSDNVMSASGDYHGLLYPTVVDTKSLLGAGSFTRWNGYCTADCPTSNPSAAPSGLPSFSPSTRKPTCTAACDVPLKVSGICDLDVILKCDKSPTTNDAVEATVQCNCADAMTSSGLDMLVLGGEEEGEEQNFCLSLQGDSCSTQLDTVATSGAVQCVQDGITYTLQASVAKDDDTFQGDLLDKILDPEECELLS